MIHLSCDYTCGAHPQLLDAIVATNGHHTEGYGEDTFCQEAQNAIKTFFDTPNADIHFLVGGTQTNRVVIDTLLRPHQGVVCATCGHINVHESGAIEAGGHKVLALTDNEGKITAEAIDKCFHDHFTDVNYEHMVQPGMVYISQPTEYGTLYSLKELKAIHRICRKYDVPLFIDGARLGYALASEANDVAPTDLPKVCDVFYAGGTKMGALMGEAIVMVSKKWRKDFRYIIKQHGALLAKGRLLGIQFKTLMTDNLYLKIGANGCNTAKQLQQGLKAMGIQFYYNSPTNQIFPILPNTLLDNINKDISYSYWCRYDEDHSVVRFCTSWETTPYEIEQALNIIKQKL
ncbi:MAG: aminotransferase class V-fold PLP-dependent enzyme [Bacteroidales bacterium]|nr:aminotransferase class V-fold PLP-dependent enzyme [Bacteroidales bacterium]